jgi:hypothetical protein
MDSSTAYTPVGKGAGSPSPAYFYMMDNLLESRRDGYPSNSDFFDEDVNVYLASLLTSSVLGTGTPAGSPIIRYDLDLFDEAASGYAPRRRFEIYRANADDLLLRLAVFDNPAGRRPGSAPHLEMTRKAWTGRCKAYYRMAWARAAETFRRPTAIGGVMGKLSENVERYIGVISSMRASCLNIIPSLSEGRLYHLERGVLEEQRAKEITALYDRFLDALSEYRRCGGKMGRKQLEILSGELRKADPAFRFDPFDGGQTPLMKSPQ